MKPARRRELVQFLRVGCKISERRACRVIPIARSSQRYRSQAKDQTALRIRLRDLAQSRVRYGYRRLHVLLAREGWQVNHKRVYRLYRLEGLSLRLTASLGVATYPQDADNAAALLDRADHRMYWVKNTTRDGIAVEDPQTPSEPTD